MKMKMNRTLITGVRLSGDSRFLFRITGNAESEFPPAVLHISSGELQEWLEHTVPDPAGLENATQETVSGILRLVT